MQSLNTSARETGGKRWTSGPWGKINGLLPHAPVNTKSRNTQHTASADSRKGAARGSGVGSVDYASCIQSDSQCWRWSGDEMCQWTVEMTCKALQELDITFDNGGMRTNKVDGRSLLNILGDPELTKLAMIPVKEVT